MSFDPLLEVVFGSQDKPVECQAIAQIVEVIALHCRNELRNRNRVPPGAKQVGRANSPRVVARGIHQTQLQIKDRHQAGRLPGRIRDDGVVDVNLPVSSGRFASQSAEVTLEKRGELASPKGVYWSDSF